MKPQQKSLVVATLLGLSATAQAALVFTTTGTQTIDFQSDVGWNSGTDAPGDNVYRWSSTAASPNYRSLIERGNWDWDGGNAAGGRGFSADAWSWSRSGQDLGTGAGSRTLYGDYNNLNGVADALGVVNSMSNQGTTALFGVGSNSASDYLVSFGGGSIPNLSAPYAYFSLTLRVQNQTGATVGDWKFALDTWHRNNGTTGTQTISLGWSTDNVNFNNITSFATGNTGNVWTANAFDQAFTVTGGGVANNDYLYLQLNYAQPLPSWNGGSALLFDNWGVTAVPVPETQAALLGGLGLLALLRRRRA